MPIDAYKRLVEQTEKHVAYWQELGIAEFLVSLRAQMQRKGVKPAEIARRMDVKPPFVSKVLSGESNLTFSTMVRFAMAIGAVVHVHVADRNAVTTWRDQDYSTRDSESAVNFGDPEGAVKATVPPLEHYQDRY